MNFADALLRRGIRYRVGATDKAKISVNCPFCSERGKGVDAHFRLCVHLTKGWGRCVHCGWKSRDAAAYVLRRLGVADVAVTSGASVEPRGEARPIELPEDFAPLAGVKTDDLDLRAKRYVLRRGVTRRQIRERKIGVSYVGRYAYRVIFPVWAGEDLKGIVARDFTGRREPKYLNSPGPKYLYGFDPARPEVVLFEGIVKALRGETAAGLGVAAVLGRSLTDEQLAQILSSEARRAVVYPDPDPAGRQGALAIAKKLSAEWDGRVEVCLGVRRPADEDDLESVAELIGRARPYDWLAHQKLLLES